MISFPKKIYVLTLVFLAIYAPIIKIGSGRLDTQAVFFFLVLILSVFSKSIYTVLSVRNFTIPLVLFYILFIHVSITLIFFSGDDLKIDPYYRIARSILTYTGCAIVCLYALKNKSNVIELVFWSIVIHAAIMIAQLLSVEFRDFSYQFTVDERALVGARYEYSMAGLTNSGGAQISVYQSLGALLGVFIYFNKKNIAEKISVGAGVLLSIISVFASGRSGLLALIIYLPTLIYIIYNTSKQKSKDVFYLLLLITVILSLLLFAANFGGIQGAELAIEMIAQRSEDIYATEGGTYSELKNHILLPNDAATFIFGDQRNVGLDQSSSDRVLNSDSGYIRILFGYGIFGSIIHYAFYIYIIYIGYKLKQKKSLTGICYLLITTSMIILLFNTKEIFVLTRIGLSQLLFIYFYLLFNNNIRTIKLQQNSIKYTQTTSLFLNKFIKK